LREGRLAIEPFILLYLLVWTAYMVLNRTLATSGLMGGGGPLSGLALLPASLIVNGGATYAFIGLSGWWRKSAAIAGPLPLPRPNRWTALSGLGAGLLLIAVPLSFTFAGVSIPFVQLLMRGDVLLIAPIVDLLARRRIRPASLAAIALVAAGLLLTLHQRGGFALPPLCWLTIAIYTIGYFLRLHVMTRIAKTPDPDELKRYFAQEQIVATPTALVMIALLAAFAPGPVGEQLRLGFAVRDPAVIGWLVATGSLSALIGLMATVILLNPRENSFCVPFERSASILGGVAASYLMAIWFKAPAPTAGELAGLATLVAAITLLTLSAKRRTPSTD